MKKTVTFCRKYPLTALGPYNMGIATETIEFDTNEISALDAFAESRINVLDTMKKDLAEVAAEVAKIKLRGNPCRGRQPPGSNRGAERDQLKNKGEKNMPKMSDHEEFLNASMVKDGDLLLLLGPGRFVDPEESRLERVTFRIQVEIPDGRTKTWTMNKTTRNRLAEAYGDDSENWVNRQVRLKILSQNVRGDVKSVLYGYPVEGKPSTQAPLIPKQQTVRFIKDYETFKAEDIATLEGKQADSLINLGFAMPVDVKEAPNPDTEPKSVLVRFLNEVTEFKWLGKTYGPYEKDAEVTVPIGLVNQLKDAVIYL